MPGAEIKAVVASTARVTLEVLRCRAGTEVGKITRRLGIAVLVVANDGIGDVLEASPSGVIARTKVGQRARLVLQIPQREDRVRVDVLDDVRVRPLVAATGHAPPAVVAL